jgi:hypothetical protein
MSLWNLRRRPRVQTLRAPPGVPRGIFPGWRTTAGCAPGSDDGGEFRGLSADIATDGRKPLESASVFGVPSNRVVAALTDALRLHTALTRHPTP